jgi:hypothetical protein
MSDKIINTFQERRKLALAVAELAQLGEERALKAAAQDIHDAYSESMIQAEILKNLDTPNSQLRGGLGHLAALLPTEHISPALRSIAADRSQSAQSRLTAALLLSHFVGDPVPPPLLSDLNQTDEVAFQSLREAVEESKKNRHILLEYTLQMRQAGDHVAPMILNLMDRLPEGDRVELLRLITLDDRETVVIDALERLQGIASKPAGANALRALHVLQFLLPPDRAAVAERMLRKLRFAGIAYHPPEPTGWRALMSIADLAGRQAIWFVRMPSKTVNDGAIIYVILNRHSGQMHSLGQEKMQASDLPPQHAIGQIFPVETDADQHAAFLETPFDFARWRVLEALPAHWAVSGELPPEFRLYSDLLWEFATPEVPPELQRFFVDKSREDDQAAWPAESPAALYSAAVSLLNHPAMEAWLYQNRPLIAPLQGIPAPDSSDDRATLVQAVLAQLERSPETAQLPGAMEAGLRAQAAWFEIAGSPETANLALTLAESVPRLRISQNPLLAAIVEVELRVRAADPGED